MPPARPSPWRCPTTTCSSAGWKLDPQAVFTLTMRQGAAAGSGYALTLRPGRQEAEISSSAFHQRRHIELDTGRPISLQAFVQGSMIETFINDQYACSCRGYDFATGKLGLAVSGGRVKVSRLTVKVQAGAVSLVSGGLLSRISPVSDTFR